MSYAVAGARQPAQAMQQRLLPPTGPAAGGGGDSAYLADTRRVQDVIASIQQRTAAIRRETSTLVASHNVAASRLKVQEAAHEARAAAEEGKRLLDRLDLAAESVNEQHMRRLTQSKLSDGLMGAIKAIEVAGKAFEEASAARDKQLQAEAATNGHGAALGSNGTAVRGDRTGVELPRRQWVDLAGAEAHTDSRHWAGVGGQRTMADLEMDVQQAELENHAEDVAGIAQQVGGVQREIQGLQRVMVDLALHTQAQGEVLDTIEANIGRAEQDTQGAREQLVQASGANRRNLKVLYCMLGAAVLLATIVVVVVVKKS